MTKAPQALHRGAGIQTIGFDCTKSGARKLPLYGAGKQDRDFSSHMVSVATTQLCYRSMSSHGGGQTSRPPGQIHQHPPTMGPLGKSSCTKPSQHISWSGL